MKELTMLPKKKLIYRDRFGVKIPTIVAEDGTYWYPAKEICSIFEFKNHRDAVQNHLTPDQAAYTYRGKPGQEKKALVVNESGVCRLMFKSKASIAVELVEKIFNTILPDIHEVGGYIRDPDLYRRLVINSAA